MAKRSRRERRQAQLARAVVALDRSALYALAMTHPCRAAHALAEAFSDPRADAARLGAVEETAADLAASMRLSGRLEAAQELAASGAGRSSRLRLEQALAAFARGDDTQAAAIAAPDSIVRGIVAPLLDAACGAPVRPVSSDDPPALRALRAVANAVSCAAAGQLDKAKSASQRLSAKHHGARLVRETRAAIALASGTLAATRRALQHLLQVPALRPFAEVRNAAVLEAVSVHPDLVNEPFVRRALGQDRVQAVLRRAAAARLGASIANNGHDSRAGARASDAEIQTWIEFLYAGGAKAFAQTHLGTAYIYEGFACIDRDGGRAEQAFDQAIEHGGDLVEALRGKLVLAFAGGGPCPGCGERHGGVEGVAAAAEQLAASLHGVARAAPVARVAWLLAAKARVEAGQKEAALAAITSARNGADRSMNKALDALETEAADCDDSESLVPIDVVEQFLAAVEHFSSAFAPRRARRRKASAFKRKPAEEVDR